MGAPKQKWTAEEEAALKAGIAKHGAGKWRTILRDPEFSDVLSLRSNVDLKDKWRNMNVMASGSGSREKVKFSNRKSRPNPKHEDGDNIDDMAISTELAADMDDDIVDVMPLMSYEPSQIAPDVKKDFLRLDHIIMEAIKTLNEPSGSQKAAIADYIEVKRKYRIAPYPYYAEQRSPKMLLLEGAGCQREEQPSGSDKEEVKIKVLTRDEVDAELLQMWSMDKEAAEALAMRAMAEAEAIMAEAEAAAKEAESAEAEAEAAQAFADAASTTIRSRHATKLVIRACI
ncbi:telomere repeat binding factor 1 isoform X2 [Carex rostrata]